MQLPVKREPAGRALDLKKEEAGRDCQHLERNKILLREQDRGGNFLLPEKLSLLPSDVSYRTVTEVSAYLLRSFSLSGSRKHRAESCYSRAGGEGRAKRTGAG